MSRTVSGNIASIITKEPIELTKATVDIEPVQELNGYSKPWLGGAGKNLLKYPYNQLNVTMNGITFTSSPEGVVINGKLTGNVARIYLAMEEDDDFGGLLKDGQSYVLTGSPNVSAVRLFWEGDTTIADNGNGATFTYLSQDDGIIAIDVVGSTQLNNVIVRPMITTISNKGASYEPFANVCPITGWSSVDLYVSKSKTEATTPYSVSLGRTVYGGSVDLVSGALVSRWANISSYNGQTLPGKWLSSMDAYSENSTPTIGAQVVYDTGIDTSYTVSGQTITTLAGLNYIRSDAGAVTIVGDFDYLMKEFFNYIYLNGIQYIRPSGFQIQREDIYAGEYETCTGKIIGDRIGWRYSNMTLTFDSLPNDKLQELSGLNEPVELYFVDDDGEHSEQVIRTGFANTPTRFTHPDGSVVWRNVSVQLRFIDAHND